MVTYEKIILFILIVVCVALGMFVGRCLLPRKIDGVLVVDNYEQENPKWYIKLFDPSEIILKRHHVCLDVARRIKEGDIEWPREN